MNILVFGMTETFGGVESVIMNYYSHMDPEKIHMDFLCNTPEIAYEKQLEQMGSKIIKIPMRSKDYKAYKEGLKDFFENHAKDYDAIWVNVCSLANIDYLKEAKKSGIPIRIIHSHNSANMDSKLRGLLHRLNRMNIDKYANVFWSCSKPSSDWFYSKKIQESPDYTLINNAIDIGKYAFNPQVRRQVRNELGIGPDTLVIGHAGRLHFQKNQTFLLDIFHEINQQRPDSILLLAGNGEDEAALKEKAASLGLEKAVRFLGVRNDIERLYQAMDAFVFPSLFEGLPLALIEAQAASLPCFASSDVIDSKAKMTDFLTFISLDQPAKVWADSILSSGLERKARDITGIARAGYDIKEETEKMEEILRRYLK